MTEAEMAVVKQFNDAMERGEPVAELIDPEIVIIDHDIPDAGDYHGHEGIRKWLVEDWGSAWESYALKSESLEDAGNVALSIFTVIAKGKGSGIETRRRNATLLSVANGRLSRLEYFTTEEEARAACRS